MNGSQGGLSEAHSMHPGTGRRVLHVLGPSSGGIRRHVSLLATCPPGGYLTAGVAGPPDLAGYFKPLDFVPLGGPSPIKRTSPDLIHAHGLTAALHALSWTRFGMQAPPVVVTVHTSMQQTLRSTSRGVRLPGAQAAIWWAARRGLKRAAAVIAVSQGVRDELGFGEVVPPALDLPEADPGARAAVRAELGTPQDRVVVLAVGRLHPDKNLDQFVESLRGTGAEGWIAGDGPERSFLEELARGSGVRLLGHRTDVGNLLQAADIFALPAHAESYGFAVLEAVSAGLPVVATRTGEIVRLVGDAGLVIPPGDFGAFREAVRRLIDSPDLRRELAGRAGARTPPSRRELVDQVGLVYNRLFSGLGSP